MNTGKYSADKMRFAWRVIKARIQTYTHTLYNVLIPIAFPRQQWLRQRALVLH